MRGGLFWEVLAYLDCPEGLALSHSRLQVRRLVGISEAMPGDASFARQLRRKFLRPPAPPGVGQRVGLAAAGTGFSLGWLAPEAGFSPSLRATDVAALRASAAARFSGARFSDGTFAGTNDEDDTIILHPPTPPVAGQGIGLAAAGPEFSLAPEAGFSPSLRADDVVDAAAMRAAAAALFSDARSRENLKK